MSIRLRLVLWYGGLCILLVLFVTLLSYSFHVRGHYDDRDRALVASAGYAAAEAATTAGAPRLLEGRSGLEVGLRLYDANGALRESTPGVAPLPPLDPRAVLAAPAGRPFDALAGLAPPLAAPDIPQGAAFGIMTVGGQRWRVYVAPLRSGSVPVSGYIEALTPLGSLDASVRAYRAMLLLVGLGGMAVSLVGGWALAGRTLSPIIRLTQTAQAIERARDLTRRVEAAPGNDEIGRLTATFNAMLESIESIYRAQQRFVADASHELRAPLTAIQGNIDLLRRRPDMTVADRNEALAEVEREATRLSRLVGDLLALARADAGVTLQQRPVELDAVVLEAFQTARPLAAKHTLTLDPFEPLQVPGHADRLKQLILILLDNALKYTPPGGNVRLGLRRDGAFAEVRVTDNGIGIDAADLPHVFARFYRADPARTRDSGGSGLGLAIAQWIVEQHDGAITLESQPGSGTTAIVRLPLLPTSPANPANRALAESSASDGDLTLADEVRQAIATTNRLPTST